MMENSTRGPSGSAPNGDSKKTTTMTFRIEENVMDVLRQESEKKQVSLNTLVGQILKRYIEWGMYEPKVGMIPIAKPVVIALFDKMSQEDLVELACKVGKNAVHDIALFMKSEMDITSFLSWLEMRFRHSAIEFNHRVSNYSHTYVMKHDLGYNWSVYHKTLLELIFNEIFHKRIEVTMTNATLMLQFEE